jgi:hypothetical protein
MSHARGVHCIPVTEMAQACCGSGAVCPILILLPRRHATRGESSQAWRSWRHRGERGAVRWRCPSLSNSILQLSGRELTVLCYQFASSPRRVGHFGPHCSATFRAHMSVRTTTPRCRFSGFLACRSTSHWSLHQSTERQGVSRRDMSWPHTRGSWTAHTRSATVFALVVHCHSNINTLPHLPMRVGELP